jgi:hypothetical protein
LHNDELGSIWKEVVMDNIPAFAWRDWVSIGGELSYEMQECQLLDCSVGYNMKWADYTFCLVILHVCN